MSDKPVTRQHRINSHTDVHALSEIRTHDPEFEQLKTVHALDHVATVISLSYVNTFNF
jgi:hypothetical protein